MKSSIEIKRFNLNDQHKFATLSGDYNPIHVDPIAARRLMFGQPVVHGLHTLLRLLDRALAGNDAVRIRTLRVEFRNPVRLGQDIFYSEKVASDGHAKLEASSATTRLVSADIQWQPGRISAKVSRQSPEAEPPHELAADHIASASGSVPLMFDPSLATQMFPNLSAHLAADQLAALLASTRVVGMRVPGMHSLLNAIDLEDSSDTSGAMLYSVDEFDDRFARAVIRLKGPGLSGTATASLRPAPTLQPAYSRISESVDAGEFASERAIVIGGSRGLGEIAVKQLAAGGASVKFSYHLGQTDARRLVGEVAAGGGRADCFPLDVRGDMSDFAEICRTFSPTLLCFFSTPSIAGAPRGKFSAPLFHELCQVYVDGFLNVFYTASAAGTLTGVIQPSSVAIDETPFGMTEYSAAKAAAENLIQALQKAYPKIRFHAPRWSRMPTDLTAAIAVAPADDPVPVVLSALRQMKQKW